jgi:hypothetical protein
VQTEHAVTLQYKTNDDYYTLSAQRGTQENSKAAVPNLVVRLSAIEHKAKDAQTILPTRP